MISEVFAITGIILLLWRLKPWKNFNRKKNLTSRHNFAISIVVPCRNEEANIGPLLESLKKLRSPNVEIIVVDDGSTDKTSAVAQSMGMPVIEAPPKPPNWSGKNWACWIGAQQAQHAYILFTDADTRHRTDSLDKLTLHLQEQNPDLLSAPPFHNCQSFWEKLTGLFHLLPLYITNFRGAPQEDRLFAIGQYLVFKKDVYFNLGGHQAIASSLVDDIDLAQLCLTNGFKYQVYPRADLYEVQMYDSFKLFLKGWTRLLRLGFKRSTLATFIEVTLLFHLVVFSIVNLSWAYAAVTMIVIAASQYNQGRFSVWGTFFIPLNVILFIYLSLLAGWETFMKTKIQWRERLYMIAFFTMSSVFTNNSEAANIALKISGMRSGEGSLAISLFAQDQKKAFPGKADKATKAIYQPLDGQTSVEIKFEDIPEGTYAVAILHDENDNKKLDSNFVGIPKEGFAFSQNPRVLVGAPSFEKCSFEATSESEALDIKMKYMF